MELLGTTGPKESLFKIGHIGFGRWPRLDMRRRAKFLQQHTLAQSLGIALTGFRKIDDPVCEYRAAPQPSINFRLNRSYKPPRSS